MYRMTRQTPLSTGQKYGDIIRDGELKSETIEKMLASGTLVKITTPPLSELPILEEQSERLAKVGVVTIDDLIEANPTLLGKKVKKSMVTIEKWQKQALKFLEPDKKSDKSG